MKIKILKEVKLKTDLTKYCEKTCKNMKIYNKNEVVDNVHENYKKRFLKFPEHIKIIEEKGAKNE